MRKAVACLLTVTLLPASTVVAQVRLSIVEGAYPGPYNAQKTVEHFGPGDTITLWSYVESEIDLDGLQYGTHVNGDADNDLFEITGYAPGPLSTYESSLGVPDGTLHGLGDVFSLAGGESGWLPSELDKVKTLPYPMEGVLSPGGWIMPNDHMVYRMLPGLISAPNGTVVGIEISPRVQLPAGDYLFSAIGRIAGALTAEYTATPIQGFVTEGDNFTLTVLANPEPSSALLGLAGLWMVVRRRPRPHE